MRQEVKKNTSNVSSDIQRVGIIGAGWYGVYLAIYLTKLDPNLKVVLLEKASELFNGISGMFGIRLHVGPHYPRSKKTRDNCHETFEQFCKEFPEIINWQEYAIYALGFTDVDGAPSKVNAETFDEVCKEFRLKEKIDTAKWGYKNLQSAYDLDEPSVKLGKPLREYFKNQLNALNIETHYNYTVRQVSKESTQFFVTDGNDKMYFDHLINTTSYKDFLPVQPELPLDMKIFYQPCLALMYYDKSSTPKTKPFSFIVMDGWFPCVMPYDDGELIEGKHQKYIMTHGKYTIRGSYTNLYDASKELKRVNESVSIQNQVKSNCEAHINKFWPDFENRFVYLKLVGTVLAKIRTNVEFRSAVTFQDANSGIVQVIPGKISNIFDVAKEVVPLIKNKDIVRDGDYRYVENGVLDAARKEITEKIEDMSRNTCGIKIEDDHNHSHSILLSDSQSGFFSSSVSSYNRATNSVEAGTSPPASI